jgi:hypothetical protein
MKRGMASPRGSVVARVALLTACVGWLAAPSFAGTPIPVPDGAANCQWLRVKVKGSGYEVPDDAENAELLGPKRTINADCYLQLVFMEPTAGNPHGRYGGPFLCPVNADEWEASTMEASFSGRAFGDGNVLADDDYLGFTNAGGDIIEGYGTALLKITVDKNTGVFKKAVFTTLAAELIDNSRFFESPFASVVGSYVAKGSSVTPDKVPPQAKMLVSGGPCPE